MAQDYVVFSGIARGHDLGALDLFIHLSNKAVAYLLKDPLERNMDILTTVRLN